jgi:hypothetical protein
MGILSGAGAEQVQKIGHGLGTGVEDQVFGRGTTPMGIWAFREAATGGTTIPANLSRQVNLRKTMSQLEPCQEADGKIGVLCQAEQFLLRGGGQVTEGGTGRGNWCLGRPTPDNPPDSSTLTITSGVTKIDFIMPDNAVVKIGYIKGTIGSQFQVHRSKPGIPADQECRFFHRPR